MNRKEIIVFSVLVNSVLLIVLFIFALRPTLKGEMNVRTHDVVVKSEKQLGEKKPELDQVDQILKEYIAKKSTNSMKKKSSIENIIEDSSSVKKKKEQTINNNVLKDQKNESGIIKVIVQQGDFLDKIARRHRTTVNEIMYINKMNGTKLRIGQILLVKENTLKKIPMNSSLAKKQQELKKYYIVKDGESPWTIAKRNKIDFARLLRLNGLNEAKAKKLKPGDKLRIR